MTEQEFIEKLKPLKGKFYVKEHVYIRRLCDDTCPIVAVWGAEQGAIIDASHNRRVELMAPQLGMPHKLSADIVHAADNKTRWMSGYHRGVKLRAAMLEALGLPSEIKEETDEPVLRAS